MRWRELGRILQASAECFLESRRRRRIGSEMTGGTDKPWRTAAAERKVKTKSAQFLARVS